MPITERVGTRIADAIAGHPRGILLAFLVAAAALGWQAKRFQIDASADTLLTRDNPIYVETQLVARRFSPSEFLMIAYEPRGHALFSEQTYADLRAIRDGLLRMDRVESVRSILNVPLLTAADLDFSNDVEPAAWTLEKKNFDPETLAAAFRGHPIYEGLLVDKKQTATALQVLFKSDARLRELESKMVDLRKEALDAGGLSGEKEDELARLKKAAAPLQRELGRTREREVKRIRRLLEPFADRAEIHMGGVHVLGFQLIAILKHDLVVFGVAIAAMICFILFLLFREVRWTAIPLACCAVSVLCTMGLFGLFGLKTTVISSNFIALQLILTLAIVIHLIVQYREDGAVHPEWNRPRLVRETLNRKIAPCFYAGATTSVGFGSLVFSGLQPVVDFGWMMIIATGFSLIVSLILFPALTVIVPGRPSATGGRPWADRLLKGFAGLSLRRRRSVAVAAVAVFALSVAGAFRLDVENSFIDYFRDSTRVHQELSYIDRNFGGSTPMDVVYKIPESQTATDLVLTAEASGTLQRIQEKLGRHRGVGQILSAVNFTELARILNDGAPLTEYELTAVYWTLEDSVREDLAGGFLAPQHGEARLAVRIQDATPGLDRNQLLADIRRDMREIGVPADRYSLTGPFVLYQDILQRLFRSQVETLGIVYAALFLTFWLIFRSFKVALIGMAPNVLSTAAVLGLMGWLKIPLDLMTITIAAIAMGIAVDDTIHYLHRYREEAGGGSGDEAIRRSHATVGHGIVYTSFIIVLGFSLLAFSDFVPSALFGLLTGFAMAMALVYDLCVLPVLLRRFVGKG